MSAFTKSVRVAHTQRTENRRMLGVLMEPIGFYSGDSVDNATLLINVPKGFITDGVTIPWFLWWFIPPWGQETAAAIIHDYMYYTQQYNRKVCDKVFLEGLEVMKTPWLTRTFAYYMVRLFGSNGYKTFKGRYIKDRVEIVEKSLDKSYDDDVYNAILSFHNDVHANVDMSF